MLNLKSASLTIGLLGGSFNPAHAGHIYISVQAKKRLKLDQIWWLVSPQNPLKASQGMKPLAKRLGYAKELTKPHPFIRVTDIEKTLGSNYTIDTVRALKKRFPHIRFVWLMGADNLENFSRWHRFREIMDTVPIAVFDRGNTYRALKSAAASYGRRFQRKASEIARISYKKTPAWGYVRLKKHPISATFLRLHEKNMEI